MVIAFKSWLRILAVAGEWWISFIEATDKDFSREDTNLPKN